MEDTDHSREQEQRDRERSRRGDRPSRFSDVNRERDRSPARGGGDRGTRFSGNRIYVSNISYECRWQELKDLFRTHVGKVSYVELFVDEKDKPNGCGIVEFSDSASVKKCMEVMHRFEFKGRRLVIKEDFNNERDKHGNIMNDRRRHDRDKKPNWDDDRERDRRDRRGNWNDKPGDGNMFVRNTSDNDFKWGPTWGLSPQFLESLGINRPLVNRIFVANVSSFIFPF